jgi:16S rRNA (uracil1498-N3)-methyltransferase
MRLVKSAVKQSKRPWMVQVEAVESVEVALEMTREIEQKWYLDPESAVDFVDESKHVSKSRTVAAIIGGEKGLTSKESKLVKESGYKPVRLGPWILRARTAVIGAAVFLGMMPRPIEK